MTCGRHSRPGPRPATSDRTSPCRCRATAPPRFDCRRGRRAPAAAPSADPLDGWRGGRAAGASCGRLSGSCPARWVDHRARRVQRERGLTHDGLELAHVARATVRLKHSRRPRAGGVRRDAPWRARKCSARSAMSPRRSRRGGKRMWTTRSRRKRSSRRRPSRRPDPAAGWWRRQGARPPARGGLSIPLEGPVSNRRSRRAWAGGRAERDSLEEKGAAVGQLDPADGGVPWAPGRSWPKISVSRTRRWTAPQSTTISGRSLRVLRAWIACATAPCPVPSRPRSRPGRRWSDRLDQVVDRHHRRVGAQHAAIARVPAGTAPVPAEDGQIADEDENAGLTLASVQG